MNIENIDAFLGEWFFADIRTGISSSLGVILFFNFLLAFLFRKSLDNGKKEGKWWEHRRWVIWLLVFGVSVVNYVCALWKIEASLTIVFIFIASVVASNIFFRTYDQGKVWLPQRKPMETPELE